MFKYYRVVGKIDGEVESLFGSYNKEDSVSEIECEGESWRDEGYKGIKLVVQNVGVAPDPAVYPELYI